MATMKKVEQRNRTIRTMKHLFLYKSTYLLVGLWMGLNKKHLFKYILLALGPDLKFISESLNFPIQKIVFLGNKKVYQRRSFLTIKFFLSENVRLWYIIYAERFWKNYISVPAAACPISHFDQHIPAWSSSSIHNFRSQIAKSKTVKRIQLFISTPKKRIFTQKKFHKT